MNNYHTHTTFCDGNSSPEEFVKKAIELGMKEIGFSAHSYTEFDSSCCLSLEKTNLYKQEINRLKKAYEGQIKIYLGIEQDYYSNQPTDDYNFVIGSVHYVKKNGEYIAVDAFKDKQLKQVQKHYGNYMDFVADYYNLVSDVYNKTKCNIIGHFDLITKFNGGGELFDEQSQKYISLAQESAKVVAGQNTFVEVNTGAIARGYKSSFYPAENLLSILASSGKPFVLSSDAHKLEHLNFGLDEAKQKLDKLGYKTISGLAEIIKW